MTVKRYKYNPCKKCIEKDGEFFSFLNSYNQAIVSKLNELSEENEELKEQITTMKGGLDEGNEIIGELQKENKQLKQDKRRIMNYLLKHKDMDEEDIQEIFDNEYYDKLYFRSE